MRDGWGYSEEKHGNAVYLARTPNNDRYLEEYPWTLLKCTGNAVGVPEGTQGGSEPGHLTIGAGRVVLQPFEEINRSIDDGSFYSNPALLDAVRHVKDKGSKLHLMGLHSDQGIHGTTHHLYAMLELARRENLERAFIHCFLDGRDVPERSAKAFIEETLRQIDEKGVGEIASLMGRYYAMDRDTNWERTERAYDLLTLGEGHGETDALQAIDKAYRKGDETDYYLEPMVIKGAEGDPLATMEDGDAVIFWNFRSDRARQITYALTKPDFHEFRRRKFPEVHFTCMSDYDQQLDLPVAFPHKEVENNLPEDLRGASGRGSLPHLRHEVEEETLKEETAEDLNVFRDPFWGRTPPDPQLRPPRRPAGRVHPSRMSGRRPPVPRIPRTGSSRMRLSCPRS